ncbi:DUF262 domain-containing protein [Falsiroseomonas bella]|uniref:DUF262 domain-containing protein n=1 Tax=Falsiroseomonas bella TaxID=2184016 RepID=UPI0018EEA90E|nr:DUF262 domain-containing protein [Falsiroseomonas bella]
MSGLKSQKQIADVLFPVSKHDDDEPEVRNIPPEQRRLHTETADYTVASLHQYLANGKVRIPEFQRKYVWKRTHASRLIESLIIQCPIPIIYLSQNYDGNLLVIDGNQRLLSIKLFLNDGFELQGLTTYPELNGYSWSTLDPRFKDHIENRTIRCITILNDTHPQIKFDVFQRLNTGAVSLNAQELRHGLNFGPLMKKIKELAENKDWLNAVGIKADKRMKAEELILRFFALRHDRQNYQKPLSGFLDEFSSKNRDAKPADVEKWSREFLDTFQRIRAALGKHAFRLIDTHTRLGPFNSALYDAQMIAFAETTNPRILDYLPQDVSFQAANATLLSKSHFLTTIRQATSDESSVKNRIVLYKSLVDNF